MNSKAKIISAFAVFATVILMASVPLGFAATFIGTTENTGNDVTSGYFTVELYTKDGDVYTPVSEASVLGKAISKDASNTTVSGTHSLAVDNLYMKVVKSYESLPATFALTTPSFSLTDGGTPISGASFSLQVGSSTYSSSTGAWTGSTAITVGTYYQIGFSVTFASAHTIVDTVFQGSANILVVGSVSLNGFDGIYLEAHACELTVYDIVDEVNGDNDGNPGVDGYEIVTPKDEQGNDRTYTDSASNTYPAVNIRADEGTGGIAQPDGSVDVTLYLPAEKRFLLVPVAEGGKGTFSISVSYYTDDVVTKTYSGSVTVNGNHTKYVGHSGNSDITSYENFDTAIGYNIWFPSTSDKVTVHLEGDHVNAKIQFDIVFEN